MYGYPERLLVPTLITNALEIANALGAYRVPVTLLDVGQTFATLHPELCLRSSS